MFSERAAKSFVETLLKSAAGPVPAILHIANKLAHMRVIKLQNEVASLKLIDKSFVKALVSAAS